MAAPALGGLGCFLEAIAEGGVLDFGNPGIDTNRHVRHRSAEEMGANPLTALHGVIFEIAGPGDQPCRVSQHPRTLVLAKTQRLLIGPFPVVRQAVGGMIISICLLPVAGAEKFVGFLFAAVFGLDVEIPGREQLREHIFVAFKDIADR